MADTYGLEVPETLEGWYVLHDVYAVNWAAWRALGSRERDETAGDADRWLTESAACPRGDSALYSVLTQKGDLMFLHYRQSPEELNRVELSLRRQRLFDFLIPAYSYLSVIEIALHELTSAVHKNLVDLGVDSGADEYEECYEKEMNREKRRAEARLFGRVPEQRYICFYRMNRRRGEHLNWYTLGPEDRRELVREDGRISHKYDEQLTQVTSGSIGLDDWEYAISLFADDAGLFKKLLYERRFDPASALYADFGPVTIGVRRQPDPFAGLLAALNGEP